MNKRTLLVANAAGMVVPSAAKAPRAPQRKLFLGFEARAMELIGRGAQSFGDILVRG